PHAPGIEQRGELQVAERRRDRRVVAQLESAEQTAVTASLADRVSTHAVRATQREVFRGVEVSRCPLAVEAAEQREPSGHLLEPREGEREAIEMSLRL